jgi:glycosyltransferase involved in cell wall biosynthesis
VTVDQEAQNRGAGGRTPKLLSVVVPLYNEEEVIPLLFRRLLAVLTRLGCPFEIVAVDDGSRDGTRSLLAEQVRLHPEIRIVCLTRNFGLQGAVAAGLAHARGDAIVLMDGDLQDPPELISELLARWSEGADVVYATKRSRTDRGGRRLAFEAFHWLFAHLGSISLPLNTGNLSLIDGRALAAINRLPERNRYLPGLRAWVGFKQVAVPFDRPERAAGDPRMSLSRLFKLALDGIFGFSYIPLRVATGLGMLACSLGLVFIVWVLVERFVTHTAILGWPSLMIAVCLIGGVQLVSIGILGEYLGRIYDEVRGRPNYLVSEILGASAPPPDVQDGAGR